MSQDNLIGLECTGCGKINYYTDKNKKSNPEKMQIKKYCRHERKHTLHKETKVGGK